MRASHVAGLARLLGSALVLVCAGCGAATEERAEGTAPPDVALHDGCRADAPALDRADVVAEADLDGDGAKNEVAHAPAGAEGACADALFTTFNGHPSALATPGLGSVAVVALPGSDRELLLVRGGGHARGGYDQTLVGGGGGRLGQVLAGGRPLVGFVATDGGAAPATVRCTADGGLASVTASLHEPPGVVLAWDVRTTTYRLEGNRAVRVASTLEEGVTDPRLQSTLPQLFDARGTLADCRRP